MFRENYNKRRQFLLQNAAAFGVTNRSNFYSGNKLRQLIYYKKKTGFIRKPEKYHKKKQIFDKMQRRLQDGTFIKKRDIRVLLIVVIT